jgi:Tfp pilus assembly protein PilZ
MPNENRRDARINCNIPVVLQVDDSLIMVPCRNLSIKGMFVKGSLEIKEGTEVSISFRLPVESKTNPIIKAKGHVVWINNKSSMESKAPVGFGIQIDEIIGEIVRKRLMTFIEANKE